MHTGHTGGVDDQDPAAPCSTSPRLTRCGLRVNVTHWWGKKNLRYTTSTREQVAAGGSRNADAFILPPQLEPKLESPLAGDGVAIRLPDLQVRSVAIRDAQTAA